MMIAISIPIDTAIPITKPTISFAAGMLGEDFNGLDNEGVIPRKKAIANTYSMNP